MRLDKFISDSAAYSRREIKKLIRAGCVTVNGTAATEAEMKVTDADEIMIDGEAVYYKRFVYLILNKPQGFVSATEDRHYPVVTDLVPEKYSHYGVSPVGRLDIDTEGLLLLTNDGAFSHSIASPKKNVYKKYFAILDKPADEADIAAFGDGMVFKEFTAKAARLSLCENPCEVFVEIAEGKFHQVKRMFERRNKRVTYLKRVAIGSLVLPEELKTGEVIELDGEEIKKLIFNENHSPKCLTL